MVQKWCRNGAVLNPTAEIHFIEGSQGNEGTRLSVGNGPDPKSSVLRCFPWNRCEAEKSARDILEGCQKVAGGRAKRYPRSGMVRSRTPAGCQNRCSVRRIWHPAGMQEWLRSQRWGFLPSVWRSCGKSGCLHRVALPVAVRPGSGNGVPEHAQESSLHIHPQVPAVFRRTRCVSRLKICCSVKSFDPQRNFS